MGGNGNSGDRRPNGPGGLAMAAAAEPSQSYVMNSAGPLLMLESLELVHADSGRRPQLSAGSRGGVDVFPRSAPAAAPSPSLTRGPDAHGPERAAAPG